MTRKRESRWSSDVEPPKAWAEKTAPKLWIVRPQPNFRASEVAPKGKEVEERIRELDVDWSTIVEPPPETREAVEKVARWVAVKGAQLEYDIIRCTASRNWDQNYDFMSYFDPNHAFYLLKLKEYTDQYRDGTLREEDIQPNNHWATASFKCDDSKPSLLEPPPLSVNILPPLRESICRSALTSPPGITLKDLGVMKLTAQFLARYGIYFWHALMTREYKNPKFEFMKPAHSRWHRCRALFRCLQLEKLDEGVETAMVDLNAFVGGVDCFTQMEYAHHSIVLEPTQRLSILMNPLPQMPPDQYLHDEALNTINPDLEDPALMFPARITLKELGIMKLTAQFVARYGKYFRRALMVRVVSLPQFEFMEKSHSRNSFFNVLVDAYTDVLRPTKILKKSGACTATVLEVFFNLLQLDKLENGAETVMVDIHAFVGGLDLFAHRANHHFSAVLPPPEPISTMTKWLTQPYMLLQHTLGPLLSEYRVKAHVIEDDPPHRPGAYYFRMSPQRNFPFTFPAEMTLMELGVVKLTAQFVARYGSDFLRDLIRMPQFEFVNSESGIYGGLVDAYGGVLKPLKKPNEASVLEVFLRHLQLDKLVEGAETAMIDLNAFMGGIDYFAHMDDINYSAIMPPPQRLSTMMNRLANMRPDMLVQPPFGTQHSEYRTREIQPDLELPPVRLCGLFQTTPRGWITIEELGIIKMTAMFAARYGTHFCRELMKKVVTKPQFKFMDPVDIKFSFYEVFLDAYSRVIKPSKDACTTSDLEGFIRCLQLGKLEAGVETATIDLHAFVSGVDCFSEMDGSYYFTQMENVDYSAFMPKDEGVSMTMNRETKNHPSFLLSLPLKSQNVCLEVEPNPFHHPYDQFTSLSMGMLIRVIPSLPEKPEPKRRKFDE